RREAGRWFVSFTCEVERADRTPSRADTVIGVDLGIKHLAVFSDGRPTAESPRHYDSARRKLGRLSRTAARRLGPDRRTGQQPSKRWQCADAARNRVHYRTANLRRDALHKLTTSLAREYGTIVVEDLNVSGMLRTADSPAAWPTPGSARSGVNSPTKPGGTAERSKWRTAGSPAARRVPDAGQ
ncbi:RNA-guided endonuclease InsQ/TnpB family protein, partial [Streptomyces mirabilis]|uniref:RNA-guided endonuclease InsQ/TnpB family protein n=1 Tax=Streptomyces mirabilis TaxID=68239 RepID=UPI0036D817A0